jgi:hypothetical protein
MAVPYGLERESISKGAMQRRSQTLAERWRVEKFATIDR